MKKAVLILFITLFMIGCNSSSDKAKVAYMDRCKSGDATEKMEYFCECCYIQLLEYEETSSEFVDAIRDNCMSLLY